MSFPILAAGKVANVSRRKTGYFPSYKSAAMIIRIVRMEFRPEEMDRFQQVFDRYKHRIRAFPGCRLLELHRDSLNADVRYTYSIWDSEQSLESYRTSTLFSDTWAQAKTLFAAPPQAFSLEKMEEVQDFQDF